MAGGIGWEHRQVQSLTAIFNNNHSHAIGTGEGVVEVPKPKSKSTNQNLLACAVALGRCLVDHSNNANLGPLGALNELNKAKQQATAFYHVMSASGHQSDIPDPAHLNPLIDGYRIEGPLCPRPHGDIFMWGRSMMLWLCTKLNITGELLELVLNEWAVHIKLCEFFWTKQGIRAPGSRARIGIGRPKPFDWSWWFDNYAYSRITGIGREITPHVAKSDIPLVNVITECVKWFPEIVKRSVIAKPHLAIGCQKWVSSDGSGVATLDHDLAMNARLSGLQWDANGDIVNAWSDRSKVEVPDMGAAQMVTIGY